MVKKLLLFIVLTLGIFGIINSSFALTSIETLQENIKNLQVIADQAQSKATVAANIEKLLNEKKAAEVAKEAAESAANAANKIVEDTKTGWFSSSTKIEKEKAVADAKIKTKAAADAAEKVKVAIATFEKAKNDLLDPTVKDTLATDTIQKVLTDINSGKSAESYKNDAKIAEAKVNIPKSEIDILKNTDALKKAMDAAKEENLNFSEGASEAEKAATRKVANDAVNVKQKELNVSEQQKKITEAELNLAKINGNPNAMDDDVQAAEEALADSKKTLENLEVQRDAAKALAGESAKSQHDLECEGSKAGSCIDKPNFVINVDDISPGMKVAGKGETVQEVINYTLGTIIQKLMIGLGSIALFIMTVGGGYMILYHGQDELLSKGKSIFISGITALVVALGSYYLVDLLGYILYAVN